MSYNKPVHTGRATTILTQGVDFFVEKATPWVRAQRARYRESGTSLGADVRDLLSPFFAPAILDAARVVEVHEIENPRFYSGFEEAGQPIPLDFRDMAGITFDDVILVATRHVPAGAYRGPLMFHELVHVAQYSILGVDDFIQRYVRGWAEAGFSYEGIPLEQDAYALQAEFEAGRMVGSVEQEVNRRLSLRGRAT